MAINLPPDGPQNSQEAFAHINRLGAGTTVDDLKILALVEALGKELYGRMADGAPNDAVKELLLINGREELAHAHRVSKAIEILTGEPFPIPAIEENPFYTPTPITPTTPMTKEFLGMLAQAEFAGEDMYTRIAACFENPEALALFRQNGKEETQHGERLHRAAELCDS
jgi:rubrerythrin